MESPSLAQTHCQGPLAANGSGKPLTKEELEACKKEYQQLVDEHGLIPPVRSFMDEPDTEWRFGGPPDYSLANLLYFKGRTKVHEEGSLALIVENLVKTWEMERSHKVQHKQHMSVDQEKFRIGANGWKKYNTAEAQEVGNYNVLLSGASPELWDAANITWDDSHHKWHAAFAAFPWEVLEVFSGPPKVAFTWRHWGHFTGTYDGHKGSGELVELFGFGTATVNDKLQLCEVDIFYKADEFMEVMKGKRPASDLSQGKTAMGPYTPILK